MIKLLPISLLSIMLLSGCGPDLGDQEGPTGGPATQADPVNTDGEPDLSTVEQALSCGLTEGTGWFNLDNWYRNCSSKAIKIKFYENRQLDSTYCIPGNTTRYVAAYDITGYKILYVYASYYCGG